MGKALGVPQKTHVAQLRLMLPVSIVSAFLNNTPIVAVFIPIVQTWSRKIGLSKSQLMIPLSFASILGGTCTLMGTSTNLVVAGKAKENNISMGLFDMSVVGIPVLFTGLTYIIMFAQMLLPMKARQSGKGSSRSQNVLEEFTVGCIVKHDSKACGKTLANAGLRGLRDLYVTSVQRGSNVINAVGPDFVVNEGDVLYLTGLVQDAFPALCARMNFTALTDSNEEELLESSGEKRGAIEDDGSSSPLLEPHRAPASLRRARAQNRTRTFDGRLSKVIIADGGNLVGKTPKEASFRATYGASILSISRAGEKLEGRLGRIFLEIGDVLLIDMGDAFDWDDEATDRDLKPLLSDAAAAVRLGEKRASSDDAKAEAIEREFLIPMKVAQGSKLRGLSRPLNGLTIEQAGLRGLPGLFLVAIERTNGTVEHAVGPDATINANDILWFAGERTGLATLEDSWPRVSRRASEEAEGRQDNQEAC